MYASHVEGVATPPASVDELSCVRVPTRISLTSWRTEGRLLQFMLAQIIATAGRKAFIIGSVAIVATVASALLRLAGINQIAIFIMTAIALASLASVVG
ncbi:MAG TPA: hypothetical protein VIG47_14845, partial [Gemmatimonadaceae bacterium]